MRALKLRNCFWAGLSVYLLFTCQPGWAISCTELFGREITDPESKVSIEYDSKIPVPQYLYHWTKLENLQRMAGDRKPGDPFPDFNPVNEISKLGLTLPALREAPRGGLFTWTHPTLAMKGGPAEIYGDIPIKFTIDPKARVLFVKEVFSSFNTPQFKGPVDFSRIDLIYNGREWLIVNPDVIQNATSDPRVLKAEYLRELGYLLDRSHVYDKSQVHLYMGWEKEILPKDDWVWRDFREEPAQRVQNYVNLPFNSIPDFFLRDEKGNFTGLPKDAPR